MRDPDRTAPTWQVIAFVAFVVFVWVFVLVILRAAPF